MKNILIVEDDLPLVHSLAFTLKRHHYSIMATQSAKDALAMLLAFKDQNEHVDLLISDIQLPDMTGKELVHELVERKALPPTLVMTAFGTEELYNELKQQGVRDCIDKPFDIQELVRRVSAIV